MDLPEPGDPSTSVALPAANRALTRDSAASGTAPRAPHGFSSAPAAAASDAGTVDGRSARARACRVTVSSCTDTVTRGHACSDDSKAWSDSSADAASLAMADGRARVRGARADEPTRQSRQRCVQPAH